MKKDKAVVLLSGGLDSTTTLFYALNKGYECYALIFDYGQRHRREVRHAVAVAKSVSVAYYVLRIKMPWQGSALLDPSCQLPVTSYHKIGKKIPPTYVPARNTVFLSFALSYAEAIGAEAIFIGANAVDYSGYPDCRPEFIKAFQNVVYQGTRSKKIKVVAPLIKLAKQEIVKLGRKLKAPLHKTWSCYAGGRKPCGVCDSCRLREKGFASLES